MLLRLLLLLEPTLRIPEVDRWGPCAHVGKATTLSGQIGFMHRPERDTATRTGPALKLSMCPTAQQIARTSVILYSIFLMYESPDGQLVGQTDFVPYSSSLKSWLH